jgi:hypothetical protein
LTELQKARGEHPFDWGIRDAIQGDASQDILSVYDITATDDILPVSQLVRARKSGGLLKKEHYRGHGHHYDCVCPRCVPDDLEDTVLPFTREFLQDYLKGAALLGFREYLLLSGDLGQSLHVRSRYLRGGLGLCRPLYHARLEWRRARRGEPPSN